MSGENSHKVVGICWKEVKDAWEDYKTVNEKTRVEFSCCGYPLEEEVSRGDRASVIDAFNVLC